MSQRPSSRRRVVVAAIVPVVLALTACGMTVDGTARPGDVPPIAADGVSYDKVSLKESFEETPQEVEDYWKKRDLNGTKAQEFGPNDTSGPKDEATGDFMPPSTGDAPQEADSGLGDVKDAQPFPQTGLAGSTAGQLFFTIGEDAYRCSATVVNSETRDLLLTAAHCLFETSGTKEYASNVVFIPAASDNSGTGPYGQWFATEVFVPIQFTQSAHSSDHGLTGEGWSYDFAYIRLAPNEAGQKIQDVTGGQGIGFGIPTQSLVAIGYPAGPPYDGSVELYCSTTSRALSASTGYTMNCSMTGGASGGGWIARYDPATGAGYAVAASSTGAGQPGQASIWIQSMPLGAVARDMFIEAGGMK